MHSLEPEEPPFPFLRDTLLADRRNGYRAAHRLDIVRGAFAMPDPRVLDSWKCGGYIACRLAAPLQPDTSHRFCGLGEQY